MKHRRRLRALAMLGLALAVACDSGERRAPSGEPTPTGFKVLLLGIDGATWDVIDPLLASGKLPTLRRLIENGSRAPLESQEPMLSPSIWTTIATGRNRSEHGIVRFVSASSTPENLELVASTDRRVPALWNMLDSYRRSVGVIGWWASWPAEPVDGFVVSDRVAWSRWQSWTEARSSTQLTYPEDLFARIRERVVDPVAAPPLDEMFALAAFDDAEKSEVRDADHPLPFHGPSVFKFGFSEQKTYENVALALLPESQPELSMVFLVAADPISHAFWHYYRPSEFHGVVKPEDAERLGRLVPAIYEHDDAYLGMLLSRLDPKTVVIVISDHGFKASGKAPGTTQTIDYRVIGLPKSETLDKPVNVSQSGVHELHGVLIASGGPFVRGASLQKTASVLDIAPTVLALLGLPVATNMPGRVLEELFDPGFFAAHPVQQIAAYEDRVRVRSWERTRPSEQEDAERTKQLKALGYTDVGPPEEAQRR